MKVFKRLKEELEDFLSDQYQQYKLSKIKINFNKIKMIQNISIFMIVV